MTIEDDPSAPLASSATLDAVTIMNSGPTETNNKTLPLTHSTEENGTNDSQKVQDFLRRLPPMERTELQSIVNTFVSISKVDHGDADDSPSEETFWKEYNIRTCHPAHIAKDEQQSKKPSLYADEIRHLREQIMSYQKSHYSNKDGVTARFFVAEGVVPCDTKLSLLGDTESNTLVDSAKVVDDKPAIILKTYVEHLDAANGNAGYWQGSWHVRIQSETQAYIEGHLQLRTRAAERGSQNQIQSQARRTYQVTVSTLEEKVNSIVAQFEKSTLSYAEKLMMKVVQYITTQEEQFYQNLEQWFQEPQEDGLRKLRRILPITKTRFKWDSSAQRNVQLLNARKVPANQSGTTES
jgi:F-actin capping protein alpha subunit